MMRRAEEIKQQNAHVKENLNAKPKPASRKRRDAERAAARAQQQVGMHVPIGLVFKYFNKAQVVPTRSKLVARTNFGQ